MIDTNDLNSALLMVWDFRLGRNANSLRDRIALMSAIRWVYDAHYEETKPNATELEQIKCRDYPSCHDNSQSKIAALGECAEMFKLTKVQVLQYVDMCSDWYDTRRDFRKEYQSFVRCMTR